MKKYTICKDKDTYLAWPTVVKLADEELLCIFLSCESHISPNQRRLMYTKSRDYGVTWDEAQPFTEMRGPNNFPANARVRRMGNSIVAVYENIFVDENFANPADIYMKISDDEGKTWTEPIKIPGNGICPDILQLKNGDWILSVNRTEGIGTKFAEYAYISKDRGETWSDEIVLAKDEKLSLCEASLVELDDGTLVAYIRENSMMGYDCMKSISYDGGYTWSKIYNAPLPGCNRPVAGKLNNGRIFISYRFRQGAKETGYTAENTFVALTDEESAKLTDRRSQYTRIMPLDYDRSPTPDGGYTDWVQFNDGRIYIVNYITDDWNKAQIRGYSLSLDEFVL